MIELRKGVIILLHRRGGGLKDTQLDIQNAALNVDLFQNIFWQIPPIILFKPLKLRKYGGIKNGNFLQLNHNHDIKRLYTGCLINLFYILDIKLYLPLYLF